MKHEDVINQLRQDPEYVATEKELRPYLDLGNNILRLRLANKWTQKQLARKVGTRQANISRLEAGEANPRYSTLIKLSEVFGVDLQSLLAQKRLEIVKTVRVDCTFPVLLASSASDSQVGEADRLSAIPDEVFNTMPNSIANTEPKLTWVPA